jgi:hypothetical protein
MTCIKLTNGKNVKNNDLQFSLRELFHALYTWFLIWFIGAQVIVLKPSKLTFALRLISFPTK